MRKPYNQAIRDSRIRMADHADEEAQADLLSFDEIFFSVLQLSVRSFFDGI